MTSYRDWHVGMEVVCVVDAAKLSSCLSKFRGAHFPQIGGVYHIRKIEALIDRIIVYLREIDNSHVIGCDTSIGTHFYDEPGFNAKYFRPVEKRKTSIEVFKKLLNTKSEKELVW